MKNNSKASERRSAATCSALRLALADAIRSPMGVIPDSATGLVTHEELAAAEKRRMARTERQRKILRERAEAMRKRMKEEGAQPLADHIIVQTMADCHQSRDGKFCSLPPAPYTENALRVFLPSGIPATEKGIEPL